MNDFTYIISFLDFIAKQAPILGKKVPQNEDNSNFCPAVNA
jgi:hypothetical protein